MKLRWIKAGIALALVIPLAACSLAQALPLRQLISKLTATSTPSPAPASASAPALATPSPSPLPHASLSPSSAPSATPALSPSPDPWAAYFSPGGARLTVPDWDNGPWSYSDATLSVRIELKGSGNKKYLLADVHTHGPLPSGAFAYGDATGRKRALPYLIDRQDKAVFGITSDTITWKGNPKGVMIRDGKIYFDRDQAPTMAVMPDGSLHVFKPGGVRAQTLLNEGVQNSFAFGPVLVSGGKIDPSVYTNRLRLQNWRAAIGQSEPGHFTCIVTVGSFTLSQLAQLFIDNGCTVAYNLDGGHSASMVFMGEQLFREGASLDNLPQRPLMDLLVFGAGNPYVPAPSAPIYCNGVVKVARNRPAPTDGPLG